MSKATLVVNDPHSLEYLHFYKVVKGDNVLFFKFNFI